MEMHVTLDLSVIFSAWSIIIKLMEDYNKFCKGQLLSLYGGFGLSYLSQYLYVN